MCASKEEEDEIFGQKIGFKSHRAPLTLDLRVDQGAPVTVNVALLLSTPTKPAGVMWITATP